MLALFLVVASLHLGGRGNVKITKVMLADSDSELVAVGNGQLTNMDSNLYIWFV